MDEQRIIVDASVVESTDLDRANYDQFLDEMLQEEGSLEEGVTALEVVATQPPMPVAPLLPVTAIDTPPGRAVRQASFAHKASWRSGAVRGSQAQRLYYMADNGIEVSLGTPENPLDLAQARKEIQKLGELTVLIDRLLFWYWNTRRRPRLEDGKTFIGKNGSVPVTIAEIMTMLGYQKHMKREYGGGEQRYTDGFRTEDKDRINWNIVMLSAFQVQSTYTGDGTMAAIDVHGAYLRYSVATKKGVHVGYFVSPGDWINTINLPDIPSLMRIDEQIFKFDKQREQHEIRLSLYLAERFRDQAEEGTLGLPLYVPVENQLGKTRLLTMEDLLNGTLIKIDRNNLTRRFVPRIEDALQVLQRLNIIGRVEWTTPVNRQKSQWGKDWLTTPLLIEAPACLIEDYELLQASLPVFPEKATSKNKKRTKSKY